ncbi:MAG: glutamine-hydrolyzing carbamoyl-phosphate synthase small subunit [Actinomycetota bacterium]|nr:glutamine-hydrolyzing carbamoyl-phosphate synthase small subunit [Actinomycetota bacterium]
MQRDRGTPAVLLLEDGKAFHGTAYGAPGSSLGEVVFCTAMSGYQETLTDPSYRRQILVATAPQIGNTGWNDEDDESDRIQVAGYVLRDPCRTPSSWRSRRGLDEELARQGVVGISEVDTRAVARHVRRRGAMRAGVFAGPAATRPVAELTELVLAGPMMSGADLAVEVSTTTGHVVPAVGPVRFRVAAIDLGAKANSFRMLSARGIETHVLPAGSGLDTVLAVEPRGVFLSNGPGDPAAMDGPVALARELLARRMPVFGICFGHQILGRALGRPTYKMKFGHRGVNVPVVDAVRNRVSITAQNHGFAVAAEPGERFASDFGRVEVSHHCPNDGTAEGLLCLDVPAFSVQYHPEAAAGPHDAEYLFDQFVELVDA